MSAWKLAWLVTDRGVYVSPCFGVVYTITNLRGNCVLDVSVRGIPKGSAAFATMADAKEAAQRHFEEGLKSREWGAPARLS